MRVEMEVVIETKGAADVARRIVDIAGGFGILEDKLGARQAGTDGAGGVPEAGFLAVDTVGSSWGG